MPSNACPDASGKWVQCFWHPTAGSTGDSSRRKSFSHRHACHQGHLGLMPVLLATGTCHHAQDGVGYPLHPLFSSGVATKPLQASQAFPPWHYSAETGKSHKSNKSQRTEPGRRIFPVMLFTFSSLPALSSTRPHGDLHIFSCRFRLKWSNRVHCGSATDPWGNSPCLVGAGQLHRLLGAPGHFWQLMSEITFHFTQFPFQRDSKSPAVELGLGGSQIQVILCFFKSKTGNLAVVPAVLIRVSALSPQCAMQCGQPNMKPLSLAIARGRTGLKDTNKWQRGIIPAC